MLLVAIDNTFYGFTYIKINKLLNIHFGTYSKVFNTRVNS
jgi:hypothetical protein